MKVHTHIFMMLAAFLLPISVSAASFAADDQIFIATETTGDAYLAGSTVTVAQPVNGDLFAAGASVNVIGNVSEDLFAAGSSVIVSGSTGDDLRAGGSNVVISGNVGDELFAAGSLVQITSTISGNAHIAGAAVILDGTVNGNLYVGSSSASINGHVLGDVTAYAEEIQLGSNAIIDGTLTYYAENEMTFENAQVGQIVYGGPGYDVDETENFSAWASGFASAAVLIKLLGILLTGLLIGLIWPKTAVSVSEHATKKFWMSLLVGFLMVVLVPVATVLLFVSFIGWPIAIALLAASFLLCMITTAYMGVVLGGFIMKLAKKQQTFPAPTWVSILLGVVILAVLAVIPVIGWFAILLVYLAILGAVVSLAHQQMKHMH